MTFITRAPTAYTFVWSPLTQVKLICVTKLPSNTESAGLNNSKTFSPSTCTLPRKLKETRVYLNIHNSDIMKLVKYLFLTAGPFWDNWANTSANRPTVSRLKHRGEAEDWRTIRPSGTTIITFSCFSISVRRRGLAGKLIRNLLLICLHNILLNCSVLHYFNDTSILEWHEVNWI